MPYQDDMKDFDEEFEQEREEATPGGGNFGPLLPDGQHQALLTDARVTQRESDEHWQFYMKFQNPRGSVRCWRDLDHEMGRKIAASDLKLLGYEGRLSELEAACPEFINLVCNIGVRTKPGDTRDFTDVFLNGVMGPAADPDLFAISQEAYDSAGQQTTTGGGADFQGADDDIPF